MKKLIIGNWKMNPQTLAEAKSLLQSFEHRMHIIHQNAEVVVCPPYLYFAPFSHYAHMIGLGAQNMSSEPSGAYTGEISVVQLKQWNTKFVILGHSERRLYFSETDDMVNEKVLLALKHEVHPVVCLGGEKGVKKLDTKRLVTKQFASAIKGVTKEEMLRIVFAYEPVWAISTMKNSQPASGEHVVEMVEHIRDMVAKKTSKDKAKRARILYGGTVNKTNVHEYAKFAEIDGALVGSASLDSENFWAIVKEFSRESIHKE
jgi:triosephosphate isomerase